MVKSTDSLKNKVLIILLSVISTLSSIIAGLIYKDLSELKSDVKVILAVTTKDHSDLENLKNEFNRYRDKKPVSIVQSLNKFPYQNNNKQPDQQYPFLAVINDHKNPFLEREVPKRSL